MCSDASELYPESVQWHPEWDAVNDPVSRPLFEGFGVAVHRWAEGKVNAQLQHSA